MTAYGTKRRDAEFAEKNAEKEERLIQKKLSVRLCDLSNLAVRLFHSLPQKTKQF
jgi:hypothetical protein